MGFLDKKTRVIDFTLTELGRELYASGKLDFAYYSFFDDGLDYDPYYSGTLTDSERELIVENTPMMELQHVKNNRAATSPGEPVNHLFSAAPDYLLIPHIINTLDGSQISSSCDQVSDGLSYNRTNSTAAQIDLALVGECEQGNPGFVIKVFSSSSNGLTELHQKKDLSGRRSYDQFLAVKIDDEKIIDKQITSNIRTVKIK